MSSPRRQLILLTALALVVLVVALGGFLFLREWAKDARPEVAKAEWAADKATLGEIATLRIEIDAPWHRELSDAGVTQHPPSLVPHVGSVSIGRGRVSVFGRRRWSLALPLIPTSLETLEGQTVIVPLVAGRLRSPRFVTVPVPALEILSAEVQEDLVENAIPLSTEAPETPLVEPEVTAEDSTSWAMIAAAIVALAALVWLWIRRRNLRPGTPPWEVAEAKLDALASDAELDPPQFLSRLIDILKGYTASRFDTPSDAETTSELVGSLRETGAAPDSIYELLRQADGVRFADRKFDPESRTPSIDLVREFVQKTIPAETEGEQDSEGGEGMIKPEGSPV